MSILQGVESDLVVAMKARENAGANGGVIDLRRLGLRVDELPREPTITANLLRPLLLELAMALSEPPALLIASGLLADQVEEVARAFSDRQGLHERARRQDGEWSALLLERAPRVRILSP